MENKRREEEIAVLDLTAVKVIEDLVIKPNSVMIKITDNDKSGLILPEHVKRNSKVFEIVKIGNNVKDYYVGQYVIEYNMQGAIYIAKGDDKYIVVDSYNLMLVCNKDNYEQLD